MLIRQITERVALAMLRDGSLDSEAAMVTASVPIKLNITVMNAPITADQPLGAKPPYSSTNVLRPLTGIKMKVQRGKDELLSPVTDSPDVQVFEFDITADLASTTPNFLGRYAQGPKDARFIYVNSGRYACQHGTRWDRRAKVSLMSIDAAQIDKVLADNSLTLQTEFEGMAAKAGRHARASKE